MEHMRYLPECILHVGHLFRYVYKSVCRFLIFVLLIVSAFCKRLSDMTMYMWLITLQKHNKNSGSGFYLWYGFCFSLVVFYWDMVRSDHLSYEVDLFKTRIRIMSA